MWGLLEESQDAAPSCHCRLLQAWLSQDLDKEVDVSHGQPERLVLAQFFVWWVCGNEFPQLGKGAVDILLPPPLPGVGEDLPCHS